MTSAVVILMFITSMGIFGFLSKAHLENSVNKNADVSAEYATVKADVDQDNKIVSDIDKQLEKLDNTSKDDYNIMSRQNKLRTQLAADKKAAQKRLRENNKKLAEANLQVQKVEVEVGPLKYIAELIYGESARDHLDNAVRIVILLLVFVFDPLAVMLLIAASKPTEVKTEEVEVDEKFFIKKDDVLNLDNKETV
jgi:septal ring factor EnvC (AmiA/AmiB activator)